MKFYPFVRLKNYQNTQTFLDILNAQRTYPQRKKNFSKIFLIKKMTKKINKGSF